MTCKGIDLFFVATGSYVNKKEEKCYTATYLDGEYTTRANLDSSINSQDIPLYTNVNVDLEVTMGKYPKVTLISINNKKEVK